MRLHKIRVEKISLFLLNKHSVHNFGLLPIMFQVQHFSKTFSIFYMLNSRNRVFNPYF